MCEKTSNFQTILWGDIDDQVILPRPETQWSNPKAVRALHHPFWPSPMRAQESDFFGPKGPSKETLL